MNFFKSLDKLILIFFFLSIFLIHLIQVIISTKKESENSHLLISNNTNQATSITSTSQVIV